MSKKTASRKPRLSKVLDVVDSDVSLVRRTKGGFVNVTDFDIEGVVDGYDFDKPIQVNGAYLRTGLRNTENVVKLLYRYCRKKDNELAMGVVFTILGGAIEQGDYHLPDKVMGRVLVEKLTSDCVEALLAITLEHKHKFPNRIPFIQKVVNKFGMKLVNGFI